MSNNNRIPLNDQQFQLKRPSQVEVVDESNRQPRYVYKTITPENRVVETPQKQNNNEILNPNTLAKVESLVFNRNNPPPGVKRKRQIRIVHEYPPPSPQIIYKKASNIKFIKENDDTASTITQASSDFYPSKSLKLTKKLLSGFHPYHDEESDVMALQCSTCCIGCWRNCSHRCTGCENFISCPIYCWMGFILPLIIILFIGFIVSILYAAHLF